MINFIKKLLSESPEISSTRFGLINGIILIYILTGLFILIALESVNWKLDLSILNYIIIFSGVILGNLVILKSVSKYAENKGEQK